MPLKLREKDIEAKVVAYAKSRGVLTYKFSSFSHRGVADRIFIGKPHGYVLFLELKRPGEKPTALQQKFIDDVRAAGAQAHWADSVEAAKTLIDLYCL